MPIIQVFSVVQGTWNLHLYTFLTTSSRIVKDPTWSNHFWFLMEQALLCEAVLASKRSYFIRDWLREIPLCRLFLAIHEKFLSLFQIHSDFWETSSRQDLLPFEMPIFRVDSLPRNQVSTKDTSRETSFLKWLFSRNLTTKEFCLLGKDKVLKNFAS